MGISGSCRDEFGAVRQAFEANFTPRDDSIFDEGASVAVTIDGELVVDLWGGTADRDAGTSLPWESDTIINVWSTTKTVAALAMLVLADRGELDLYAPVARYWPEFAAAGKEDVAVRHVMSHTAGLSGFEQPIAPTDLYDRRHVAALLAAQAPWWEPGTASGYHAITQGYLEGEIVQRITGQSLGDLMRAEITGPLDADFHIGTPAEHDHRVAHVVPPAPLAVPEGTPPDSVLAKTFGNLQLDAAQSWEIDWRRAEIPAAGGHGNARSVAQVHAPMACGGEANGVRLLGKETIDAVFDEQCNGTDLVLGVPLRHGIGFGLPSPDMPISPNERTCFWGGWGGSLAIVDLENRMTFSYVMNKMGEGTVGDMRGAGLLMATYMALAQL
ncbi:MAG TPA: serine hydrolase domain-containing protein [Ilumatobacteraceae bacterium]|nr:serine hydrolase domain-containing protein [Ilumatobacteraceae bacterium]